MGVCTAAARYAHTLRRLRLRQLAGLLRRRVLPQLPARPPRGLGLASLHPHRAAFLAPVVEGSGLPRHLAFLNDPHRLPLNAIDWRSGSQPKLWRYNLHYMDYLRAPGLTATERAALVGSWIAGNPPGSVDAWEAYPISLRAVNWIKAFSGGLQPQPPWLASLALQLAWLERNLEFHLGANHLLKNAKALVFGGAFFTGAPAARWLARGVALMVEQGAGQLLPDGGHYERSAMYHGIVLEDVLDVVNLLEANPALAGEADRLALRAAATRAWHYLADILAGDDDIPLFNDAAFGIAPAPAALLDYGARVLGLAPDPACTTAAAPRRICRPDTGYYGYRAGGESLLIDCGPGGPDDQPGHTHADMLSYELCLDGERVVVDSGTYDYEVTPLRAQLRGTAAHNTVVVDGADQSEVWGGFRVARRARPLFARLGPLEEGHLAFHGAHDGYRRLPGGVLHERRITASIGAAWDIADRLTGSGGHRIESFIHLHPACRVEAGPDGRYRVLREGRTVLWITPRGDVAVELRQGPYCPEFGCRQEGTVVVLLMQGPLPLELGYRLARPAAGLSGGPPGPPGRAGRAGQEGPQAPGRAGIAGSIGPRSG
ncbi:MAG: alginate lyase family protein [Gammaproteobacteria bacterium]|nr:alginate lyase family protein [Gammaproteobacteria bacterium]